MNRRIAFALLLIVFFVESTRSSRDNCRSNFDCKGSESCCRQTKECKRSCDGVVCNSDKDCGSSSLCCSDKNICTSSNCRKSRLPVWGVVALAILIPVVLITLFVGLVCFTCKKATTGGVRWGRGGGFGGGGDGGGGDGGGC